MDHPDKPGGDGVNSIVFSKTITDLAIIDEHLHDIG